jgi:hypothetical protein
MRRSGAGKRRSRTSFAPETIAARRNKPDRTRQIFRKINASESCPVAHNGLVGGSSPPGHVSAMRAATKMSELLNSENAMVQFRSSSYLLNTGAGIAPGGQSRSAGERRCGGGQLRDGFATRR